VRFLCGGEVAVLLPMDQEESGPHRDSLQLLLVCCRHLSLSPLGFYQASRSK
jgi:hypothetical protein